MSSSDPALPVGRLGTAMTPWVITVALSLMLGLQPVITDLYLPALPQMQRALGISQADAQWTLSVVVLAFGVAQMVWGPVSDRIGRRPVLLCGLAMVVLASAVTVAAPNLAVMIAARAVQGLGLAGALVGARAMIRDLYEPEQGARMLSKGMSGMGIIVLVAPILGGLTATWFGWRATLAVVGLFALLGLAFVALLMRETLALHRRQDTMSLAQRLAQWRHISVQPMFRAYTALTSSTYAGLYVFLAASSFVFIEVLHVSRPMFGVMMSTISVSYLLGTMACRRLLPRRGLPGTVRLGAWLSASSGAWCLGVSALSLSQAWVPSAWLVLPGLWLYTLAHGIHQPCSQTGVVAGFPDQAGAASALSGFILSTLAFAISVPLSAWMKHPQWTGTIHPMTLGVGLGALVTAAIGLSQVQRHGHPTPLLVPAA